MKSDIEQVEINIEEAKKAIEKGDALNRLIKNKDFKLLIDDGYFKEEASRMVGLIATPAFAPEKEQLRLQNSISAISYLRQYFGSIYQVADQALKAVEEYEELRNELVTEEAA